MSNVVSKIICRTVLLIIVVILSCDWIVSSADAAGHEKFSPGRNDITIRHQNRERTAAAKSISSKLNLHFVRHGGSLSVTV